MAAATNLGRGSVTQRSPRFEPLLEVLQGLAVYSLGTAAPLGFRVVQIGSVLQFQVIPVVDRSDLVRFDIDNGTLTSEEVAKSGPNVTYAIVAGQGEGTARTMVVRTTPDSVAAETSWGRVIETFIDQRNTNVTTELNAAGDELLAAGGSTSTSVKAIPADTTTMRYGIDWLEGDTVGVTVSGQPTTSVDTGTAWIVNKDACVVGAAIGDVTGFQTTDALTQRVEDIDTRLGKVERNVGTTADGLLASTGDIKTSIVTAAPTGWLMCDGSNVSRTTYAALFAALNVSLGAATVTVATAAEVTLTAHGLGTGQRVYLTTTGALPTGLTANTTYYVIYKDANTIRLATTLANAAAGTAITTTGTQSGVHALVRSFGAGNGSTTFTLPDLRGRTVVGQDTGQTEFMGMGQVGGFKTTRHGFILQGINTSNFQDTGSGYLSAALTQLNTYLQGGSPAGSSSSATTGVTVQALGGSVRAATGSAVEVGNGQYTSSNLQPYIALNYLIKT